jgi:hypothetical protein
LRQLETYPLVRGADSEPFFSLWSALCHQGDVHTASYAASPIILSLAQAQPEKATYDYLLLPTSIEIARLTGRGPELRGDLSADYLGAVQSIPKIVGSFAASRLDETFALTCAAAIAVAGGHALQAEAILELEGNTAEEFLEWFSNR